MGPATTRPATKNGSVVGGSVLCLLMREEPGPTFNVMSPKIINAKAEERVTKLIEGSDKVQLSEDRNRRNDDEISVIAEKKRDNTVKEGSSWDLGSSKDRDNGADPSLLLTVTTTISSFVGAASREEEAARVAVAVGRKRGLGLPKM
ncbi:hypothetical protein PIB30_035706 [Stylosanthes scabra]|uniref:Uncharacterized protein n=1 Tax=Stylosanthes scabra TaxID=79078 RepID=A0ABU6WED5_9FABA|nr:hypothetical protein [Stylosanthes scabra]